MPEPSPQKTGFLNLSMIYKLLKSSVILASQVLQTQISTLVLYPISRWGLTVARSLRAPGSFLTVMCLPSTLTKASRFLSSASIRTTLLTGSSPVLVLCFHRSLNIYLISCPILLDFTRPVLTYFILQCIR